MEFTISVDELSSVRPILNRGVHPSSATRRTRFVIVEVMMLQVAALVEEKLRSGSEKCYVGICFV